MDKQYIIQKTEDFVREKLDKDATGHDWFHIERVCRMALDIAEKENADTYVVNLAALLHDIADWKFHNGDEEYGPQVARTWLSSLSVDSAIIDHVCSIIKTLSFKGAGVSTQMHSLEGAIVQDADRLDAMGAIGIARCFAYGGAKNRQLYNPAILPQLHTSFEEYKKAEGPTINHFYEKLLLLKDRMNTATAKQLACERHEFMEQFLKQFFKEV